MTKQITFKLKLFKSHQTKTANTKLLVVNYITFLYTYTILLEQVLVFSNHENVRI